MAHKITQHYTVQYTGQLDEYACRSISIAYMFMIFDRVSIGNFMLFMCIPYYMVGWYYMDHIFIFFIDINRISLNSSIFYPRFGFQYRDPFLIHFIYVCEFFLSFLEFTHLEWRKGEINKVGMVFACTVHAVHYEGICVCVFICSYCYCSHSVFTSAALSRIEC